MHEKNLTINIIDDADKVQTLPTPLTKAQLTPTNGPAVTKTQWLVKHSGWPLPSVVGQAPAHGLATPTDGWSST